MNTEALEKIIKEYESMLAHCERELACATSDKMESFYEGKIITYEVVLRDLKACVGKSDVDTGIGLHLADVNGSISAKAEMINALTNAMKTNREVFGGYHNLQDTAFMKLMKIIESV